MLFAEFAHFSRFLFLSLLLLEVLGTKDRPIKASPQAWRYFNPGSEAVLRHMLSDWARVQKSTMAQCEQHEDDVKEHQ